MDAHEEDRIATALRAASSKLFPGVSDRVALCREAASLLGWKRVTKKKWETLDHGYRLALHRKVWLRQSEGARGPYPYADARPIARYTKEELQVLGEEALRRTASPASEAEGAVILARYLGFTTVPPDELSVLAAAVAKVNPIAKEP